MARETITVEQYKAMAKKPSKYKNKKTVIDGVAFDSAAEARHWQLLKCREKAGEITELRRQVPFLLCVNGQVICTYRADMTYKENGKLVTVDVKGFRTEAYRLKKKLMFALEGISITEIGA